MNAKHVIFGLLFLFVAVLTVAFIFSQPAVAPITDLELVAYEKNAGLEIENSESFDLSMMGESDPNVLATSYLLMETESQTVILQNRISDPLPVASLTKLMTAWTVIEHGDMGDVYEIDINDVEPISPSLGLSPGDQVFVKDLVYSILIGSANDGALALSHYIEKKVARTAQNESISFIDLMNKEAEELGMTSTRFTNPIGFDSVANYSSVLDMLLLIDKLESNGIMDEVGRQTSYSFQSTAGKSFILNATNKLIAVYPDIRGIKTGYTNLAQGSMITKVVKDQKEYLIVVIGSQNREADTLYLRSKI